jgi:hypothetical protein
MELSKQTTAVLTTALLDRVVTRRSLLRGKLAASAALEKALRQQPIRRNLQWDLQLPSLPPPPLLVLMRVMAAPERSLRCPRRSRSRVLPSHPLALPLLLLLL